MSNNLAYLLLATGDLFTGVGIGASGVTVGEVVFTTGMTGYQETLTDASYYGQIVTQTYPLVGNYGINNEDVESSKSWVNGYIVREMCIEPSNFRCNGTLDSFLKEQNIIGISNIDTRGLTKIIRNNGVLNGAIYTADTGFTVEDILPKILKFTIENAVENVTTKQAKYYPADNAKRTVALLDYGVKTNIIRLLNSRGCNVHVLPASTKLEQIKQLLPDGIMLSNGPSDPAENIELINNLKEYAESGIPIFGICLGHQLMALAMGGSTTKLKFGHRGVNQPVSDLDADRTFITSQNHGYAVVAESIPASVGEISHINANDGTVEGVKYIGKPIFTVQFHPEASGGTHDTAYLFDKFCTLIDETKKGAN